MTHEPDALPRVLPPGQRLEPLRVEHYGRVPSRTEDRWTVTVSGATASGEATTLSLEEIHALPTMTLEADLHCVSRWSALDLQWSGAAARSVLALAPPADEVSHVLVVAEYGYSATLRLSDIMGSRTVFAWGMRGGEMPREHGYPLRLVVPHLYSFKSVKWVRAIEYLNGYRAGFWESRGYHHIADAWREERYGYQQ